MNQERNRLFSTKNPYFDTDLMDGYRDQILSNLENVDENNDFCRGIYALIEQYKVIEGKNDRKAHFNILIHHEESLTKILQAYNENMINPLVFKTRAHDKFNSTYDDLYEFIYGLKNGRQETAAPPCNIL